MARTVTWALDDEDDLEPGPRQRHVRVSTSCSMVLDPAALKKRRKCATRRDEYENEHDDDVTEVRESWLVQAA